jgi:hypothetical protein
MSEVKVNKISPRTNCGTTQLGDAGDTITVTGDLKSNSLKSASGSTITLGQSGDTIQLGCGASQTGFGRTGTVDWDTTAKTASFTAVSGNGYFVNTTSGAITLTLPASPSAGDIVAFKDYAGTFATNNLTIGRNGSNLDGNAGDKVIVTSHTSMSLVYVDGTQGWKSVEEGTGFIGENYIVATGGTITTCGNCKIHTFTGPGTFCVSSLACAPANNQVSYMVVAGGGGGGIYGGGGGAGGFREDKSPVTPYTASPLEGAGAITVTATGFPITVGGGGASASPSTGSPAGSRADNGSNSVFSTITSAGGGGAGSGEQSNNSGDNGGSGGGGAPAPVSGGAVGGSGNTPPVTPSQGFPGGSAYHNPGCYQLGGGGGGATVAGANAPSTPIPGAVSGGPGGTGATTSISGSPTAYAGGGGGAGDSLPGGTGGTGGGGTGGNPTGFSGTANTGGGGGGGTGQPCTGSGGSGIVIIRYKYQ